MLVVDASVVAPIVGDGGPDGKSLRARIKGEVLAAPDLLHTEIISVLRRQLLLKAITRAQADAAIGDLIDLPIEVYPTKPLLARVWGLHHNVTPYDACYIALAETLECTLLTGDARLSRRPTIRCDIETVAARSAGS